MKPGISALVTPFTINEFMETFQKPYSQWKAFQNGAIDNSGHLTGRGSISPFEFLVLKIRQWLEKLCPSVTKTMLGSYAGMYNLMYESAAELQIDIEYPLLGEHLVKIIENLPLNENDISFCEYLLEEMTSGGAGLAAPASSSTAGGVMGFDAPMGQVQKRTNLPSLKDIQMYEVTDENEFKKFRESNYYKRLKERSKDKKIAVRILNSKSVKFI